MAFPAWLKAILPAILKFLADWFLKKISGAPSESSKLLSQKEDKQNERTKLHERRKALRHLPHFEKNHRVEHDELGAQCRVLTDEIRLIQQQLDARDAHS